LGFDDVLGYDAVTTQKNNVIFTAVRTSYFGFYLGEGFYKTVLYYVAVYILFIACVYLEDFGGDADMNTVLM
jgi:hypothetical protein